jgi:hypothetical protein
MRRLIFALMFLLLVSPLNLAAQNSEPAPEAPPPGVAPPSANPEEPPPPVAPPSATTPEVAPAPAAPAHHHKRHVSKKHRKRHKAAQPEVETTVEPASARLKVASAGAPIYAKASHSSEQIGALSTDKYVQVTGSTKSFLQVQLKDGRVGYIEPSTVYMVTPYDKEFLLTADSPVYSVPNQWGRKLAEVHRGRYIHVIGQALAYLKIRMKDGTEGYVPMTAAQ